MVSPEQYMGVLGTLLLLWSTHAVIAAAMAAPVLFLGRKRIDWANWELLALIIPFCVWVVLMLSPLSIGRKPTNLVEPLFVSFAMPVVALLRVAAGRGFSERVQAASLIALLCGVALTAFFIVPMFKPTTRRGLTSFDSRIIDAHEQRYMRSCIPSSVEMVLKLMGRVPPSYYALQKAWKNKADGSFHDFDGKTFEGVTFHQQFRLARNSAFPLSSLFETIERELKAGRFVIVGLPRGSDFHNWVIYDEDLEGDFLAVSKFGPWTIERRHVKKAIARMHGTDIGTYEANIGTNPAQRQPPHTMNR
ncbi:MAG TPA: hypothetical protein VJA21_11010 [Verrucomicrobiae bacterium]